MNNFNSNNEDNETVRQTLTRVAQQYGWFDNPVNMNIDGNNVTYYVDHNSPFAQNQQTLVPNRQMQTPLPQQPNSSLQNSNAQNYDIRYNQIRSQLPQTSWHDVIMAGMVGMGQGLTAGINRGLNAASFGLYGRSADTLFDNIYTEQQNRLQRNAEQAGLGNANKLANKAIDVGTQFLSGKFLGL